MDKPRTQFLPFVIQVQVRPLSHKSNIPQLFLFVYNQISRKYENKNYRKKDFLETFYISVIIYIIIDIVKSFYSIVFSIIL